jgi:hypothetical protein
MSNALHDPSFWDDFDFMAKVRLNPARHTAPDARTHTEMVVRRVADLAVMNGCAAEEADLLRTLAYVHDIGKITGSAHPARSLDLLPRYGITDPRLVALVRSHDLSLPWFRSQERGEPPSERAWRRLAAEVDLRLLCIFMIADRVDCPGGWRANAPTVWFLGEAERRGLLGGGVVADEVTAPGSPPFPMGA